MFAVSISTALLALGVSNASFAQQSQRLTPYQECVRTCQAFSDGPGYELRACVTRCESKKAAPGASFREMEQYALRCKYEPSLCQ